MMNPFVLVLFLIHSYACDSGLKVNVVRPSALCASHPEDESCSAAAQEMMNVLNLYIDDDAYITNNKNAIASWQIAPDSKITGYKMVIAGKSDCSEVVHSFNLKEQQKTLDFLDEGEFFLCLYALTRNNLVVSSINNGIRILFDQTAPAITAKNATLYAGKNQPEIGIVVQDKNLVTYLWERVEGPADMTIIGNNKLDPQFIASKDGRYSMKLTVSDEAGNQSSQDITLYYYATALTVTAGENRTIAGSVINLAAIASERATSFLWEVIESPSGAQVTINNPDKKETDGVPNKDGTYIFKVTAKDLSGYEASAQVTMTWAKGNIVFDALALLGAAQDGFINYGERNETLPLAGTLSATDYTTASYALAAAAADCAGLSSYAAALPTAAQISSDGSYKVCVKLENSVGIVHGATPLFTRVATLPEAASTLAWSEGSWSQSLAVTATWTPAGASNIASQQLWVYSDAGCSIKSGSEIIGIAPSANSQTFNAAADGSYRFIIKTLDSAGNIVSSDCSAAVAIDTVNPAAPAAPGFSANYATTTSVAVAWVNGSDANFSTHNIKACTDTNCSANCSATTQDSASPGTIAGLVDGSVYYGCVQSVDLSGRTSAWAASTGTMKIDSSAPIAPTVISVPVSSTTDFGITFTAGTETNPSNFNIKACTDTGCSSCVGETTAVGSPGSIAASALTNATSYYGCVQATDLAGNISGWVRSAGAVLYIRNTVTYDGNSSSSGSAPSDSSFYVPGQTVTALGNTGTLARTGYAFGGWNTAANGSGSTYSAGQTFNMGSSSLTLYARWTINSYSVTYDGNGNTGGSAPNTASYNYNATVTVAANTGSLTKTSFYPMAWNTAVDGSGTIYTLGTGTFAMGAANITLYAHWAAIPTCGGPGDSCYSDAEALTAGVAVTPLGKSLVYTSGEVWVASGAGTQVLAVDGADSWANALNINGRTYSATLLNKANITGRACPTNVFVPGNLVATGQCLYYDAGSGGQRLDATANDGVTNQTTPGSIRLGSWNTAEGGNGTGASWYEGNIQTCASKGMRLPTLYEAKAPDPGSNKPTDASPTFSPSNGVPMPVTWGWTASASTNGTGNYWFWGDAPYTNSVHYTGNNDGARCVAPAESAPYFVTYDANGSTSGSAPTGTYGYAAGATVTALNNIGSLAKTGYVFSGWNTASDGNGTNYAAGAGTFTMGTANVTLYAKWIVVYTMTYDGNGNTGGTVPAAANYIYGATVTVAANTGSLTNTGLYLVAWNTAYDGSGTSYALGRGTFTMEAAHFTIYAQWSVTPPVCGGPGNGCYSDAAALFAGVAVTPLNKTLEYVDTDGAGAGTFKVWKEVGSTRVLRATGMDEWAKNLNTNGKGQTAVDFTDANIGTTSRLIAGRVCPPNVYIDDSNKFTTGNCVYYTPPYGQLSQGANHLTNVWYYANLATCSSKGMRLPTIFETTTTNTSYATYPKGDGSPIFAQSNGVPTSSWTWTATSSTNWMQHYILWNGTSTGDLINWQWNGYSIKCVLP